jgi:hypothetical protein
MDIVHTMGEAEYGAMMSFPTQLVTFINTDKVRPIMVRGKPTWGWTWLKAGFRHVGETKGGLLTFQLLPADMPEPKPARPRSLIGLPLFAPLTKASDGAPCYNSATEGQGAPWVA